MNPCFENTSFQPFWIPARGREKGTWVNQYQAQGYGCDKLEETLYAQTFSALFLVKGVRMTVMFRDRVSSPRTSLLSTDAISPNRPRNGRLS